MTPEFPTCRSCKWLSAPHPYQDNQVFYECEQYNDNVYIGDFLDIEKPDKFGCYSHTTVDGVKFVNFGEK